MTTTDHHHHHHHPSLLRAAGLSPTTPTDRGKRKRLEGQSLTSPSAHPPRRRRRRGAEGESDADEGAEAAGDELLQASSLRFGQPASSSSSSSSSSLPGAVGATPGPGPAPSRVPSSLFAGHTKHNVVHYETLKVLPPDFPLSRCGEWMDSACTELLRPRLEVARRIALDLGGCPVVWMPACLMSDGG